MEKTKISQILENRKVRFDKKIEFYKGQFF